MSDVVVKWSRDVLERGASAGMAMEEMSGTTTHRAAVLLRHSDRCSRTGIADPQRLRSRFTFAASGQLSASGRAARVGRGGGAGRGVWSMQIWRRRQCLYFWA
ncbi:hypothetical protein KC19_8G041900 [Ceratodon purpureus]|uniref:Uncharacterized protein n=1 Tax=Ceratodon purpureus TaxID=3225 RepID=A0A8T0GX10_CERPU|nr:hypothetical protein KC19_8G041900 [Ceratodon purpureus]